jgi:hypothetical protein
MESDSDRETREQLTAAHEARLVRLEAIREALAALTERMAKLERDVEAANVMLAQFHAAHDARGRAEHEARLRLLQQDTEEWHPRRMADTPTLRDVFAMHALAGLLAHEGTKETPRDIATAAFSAADAMLEARKPEP